MKKLKWAKSKTLIGQIAVPACVLAGTAGIVFGIAGATFKIRYMNLTDATVRLNAAKTHNYYSQDIASQWNMTAADAPNSRLIDLASTKWWNEVHGENIPKWNENYNGVDIAKMDIDHKPGDPVSAEALAERKKYDALVLDGATHSALDHSFNQSLYQGLANFNKNYAKNISGSDEAQIYKPAQDNTQEFVNVYRALGNKTRAICLAGFSHVTPLNALGEVNGKRYVYNDPNLQHMGFVLMDGDISNNQNLASVVFRSDQGAFLTAIATAMYFYNNLHMYHDNQQDLKVAAFGGTSVPTVLTYMGGFQRGVEFFNRFVLKDEILDNDGCSYIQSSNAGASGFGYFEKLLKYSKYKDEVEQLKAKSTKTDDEIFALLDKIYEEYSLKMISLGTFDSHFSGSFSEGEAIGVSKQLLNRGASAIITVAGPQTIDAAKEIMSSNSNCIVIGVDSALEAGDYQRLFKSSAYADTVVAPDESKPNQANNIIKFSALKDLTTVAEEILRLSATGWNWNTSNESPWNTSAKIPDFAQDEILDPKFLQLEQNGAGYFKVVGFNPNPTEAWPEKAKVLYIPTEATINGQKCLLNQVGNNQAHMWTASKLKQFTCLRFGKPTASQKVLLTQYAFDFDELANETDKGFIYLDFRQMAPSNFDFGPQTYPDIFRKMVTNNKEERCYGRGVFDINSEVEGMRKTVYETITHTIDNWRIDEPDSEKAICSYGFKTCGNIENGLVSISWDGWYYLLEALKHLHFAIDSGTVPFMDVWQDYASSYCEKHARELSDEFKQLVQTNMWQQLSTFKNDSLLKSNLQHVISILGMMFRDCKMVFDNNMTVKLDEKGVPQPLEVRETRMTILDWLKNNMYFIA